MSRRAVMLVGHGTVTRAEDVPEFLRRIRHGRPPSPELVREIKRRYAVIGRSPLLETTERVAAAVGSALGLPVRVAMRYWDPLVERVAADIVDARVTDLAVVAVAPFSVHVYADVVAAAMKNLSDAGAAVPRLHRAHPYGSDAALVEAHAARIRPHLEGRSADDTLLVLSAHSLPVRVLQGGDSYQRELEASARAIAQSLGWPAHIVYQSQGEGGGEWLGPTLSDAFDDARASGLSTVVVAPVGFLADHVETLYDLDVEARDGAEARGLAFVRVPALNDDPALVAVLAAVATRAFEGAP